MIWFGTYEMYPFEVEELAIMQRDVYSWDWGRQDVQIAPTI